MNKKRSEEKIDNRLDQKRAEVKWCRNNKNQAEVSQEGNKAEVSLMEESVSLPCTSMQWIFLY